MVAYYVGLKTFCIIDDVNRTHQTRVGKSLSSVAELMSCIVQGSGLRPLLFLVYINDLINHLKKFGVNLKLFADDVKVYAKIVDICDVELLQSATFLWFTV